MKFQSFGINHTLIETSAGRYLQSTESPSIIAALMNDGERLLSEVWDRSGTTIDHVDAFFGESVKNHLDNYIVLYEGDLMIDLDGMF